VQTDLIFDTAAQLKMYLLEKSQIPNDIQQTLFKRLRKKNFLDKRRSFKFSQYEIMIRRRRKKLEDQIGEEKVYFIMGEKYAEVVTWFYALALDEYPEDKFEWHICKFKDLWRFTDPADTDRVEREIEDDYPDLKVYQYCEDEGRLDMYNVYLDTKGMSKADTRRYFQSLKSLKHAEVECAAAGVD
jgi:hypothetical protein